MKAKFKRRTDNLLSPSPALFYFLSFTVGLPMSVLGAVYALIMLFCGHRPTRYYNSICFKCRKYDGVSLGCFIFVGRFSKESMLTHELGHSVQNCLYGPLMPFVVGIPSSVRYHCRRFKIRVLHKRPTNSYYDIWFEDEANRLGENYISNYKKYMEIDSKKVTD